MYVCPRECQVQVMVLWSVDCICKTLWMQNFRLLLAAKWEFQAYRSAFPSCIPIDLRTRDLHTLPWRPLSVTADSHALSIQAIVHACWLDNVWECVLVSDCFCRSTSWRLWGASQKRLFIHVCFDYVRHASCPSLLDYLYLKMWTTNGESTFTSQRCGMCVCAACACMCVCEHSSVCCVCISATAVE